MNWKVYIIRCTDDSLYTGITTDLEKRFEQHKNKKGAKYFYAHTPQEIIYTEEGHTRSSATKREMEIKSLPRDEKLKMVSA